MEQQTGTFAVKKGLAQMLKGGVIMDVVTPEHAKIAEDAGACAVMALERVPADIRAQGGVARMSDPDLILKIMDSVSIPVTPGPRKSTAARCWSASTTSLARRSAGCTTWTSPRRARWCGRANRRGRSAEQQARSR